MNPAIDVYLADGCGRCSLYATPQCKVHNWNRELVALRQFILDCGYTETLKWSMPCYTINDKNVLILAAFKDFCSLNFFKGSLIKDVHNVLVKAGENTEAARLFKFTNIKEVVEQEDIIRAYLLEAIDIEKSGLKVPKKDTSSLELPAELLEIFDNHPDVKAAFEALTPGRQRGYSIHFSGAKQSATRKSRIEKFIPHILEGKGFHDR